MGLGTRILNRIGLHTPAQQAALAGENARLRAKKSPFASGVPITTGRYETEETAALKGSARWDTLDKMENDPHIKGSLRSNSLPLQGAQWTFLAASDSPKDIEIRDFVAANLLRESNDQYGREYWVGTSWSQRLREILRFLHDGYSMFSIGTRRQGSKVVYDRIHWLEPQSVDPHGWILDESDNIIEVARTYRTPTNAQRVRETIPVDQIMLYTWDLTGARYEGKALTRSMYGAYYRKDWLLRYRLLRAAKMGDPTVIGSHPGGMDDSERDAFEEGVKGARGETGGQGYIISQMDADGNAAKIEFAGLDGDVDGGMEKGIGSENAEIAHAGGTKSDLLGETTSGSRALGDTQSGDKYILVGAIAETICDFEMHGVGNISGLVERLVLTNFADVKELPQFSCAKIDPQEGLQNHDKLIASVKSGLVPKHESVARQVTERHGLDIPDEAFEEMAEQQEAAREAFANMPQGEGDGEEDDKDDRDTPDAATASLASTADLLTPIREGKPQHGHRFPNQLEAMCVNLAAVAENMRVGERDVLAAVRAVSRRMKTDLLRRLEAGKITPRSLPSQRTSKYRGHAAAVRDLETALADTAVTGADDVDVELDAQVQEGEEVA